MRIRILFALLTLVPALLLGACGSTDPDAPAAVARLDEGHTLGAPVTVDNLTVWPVYADEPLDLGEFLTLPEALEKGLAEVRERGGEEAGQARQVVSQDQIQEVLRERFRNDDADNTDNSSDNGADNDRANNDSDGGTDNNADNGADVDTDADFDQEGFEGPDTNSSIGLGPGTNDPLSGPRTNGTIGGGGRGGATVGTLVIENKSDLPILICAGTVVKGGKQDRQIGQDFVVQAKATVPVNAFCVEQGRWNANRFGKATEGKFRVATYNAFSTQRVKGQYENDQSGVWKDVENTKGKVVRKIERAEKRIVRMKGKAKDKARIEALEQTLTNMKEHKDTVASNSSLAVALDSNNDLSKKELDALLAAVRKHFASLGKGKHAPVGFAYAVNGKPVSIRAFAHAKVFRQQFEPFLMTMCNEAYLAKDEKGADQEAKAEQVVALVREIEAADEKMHETRASNVNGVRMNGWGGNSNCYLDRDGKKVAVTRDWTAKQK